MGPRDFVHRTCFEIVFFESVGDVVSKERSLILTFCGSETVHEGNIDVGVVAAFLSVFISISYMYLGLTIHA